MLSSGVSDYNMLIVRRIGYSDRAMEKLSVFCLVGCRNPDTRRYCYLILFLLFGSAFEKLLHLSCPLLRLIFKPHSINLISKPQRLFPRKLASTLKIFYYFGYLAHLFISNVTVYDCRILKFIFMALWAKL